MIVRDEEKNLSHYLESVRGVFDEVVVVDTGSSDRTVEIAQEFGARVFQFTWIDDFAAARNEALAHATGVYAVWLDADDVVDPPEREKLQKLLAGLRPDQPAGYVVRCACDPSPDGSGGETVVDHVRLFPIRDNIRWTYRVHEQIMPALRRAGIPVRWTDLVVRHTGYVNLALRARKRYALIARSHQMVGESAEAIRTCFGRIQRSTIRTPNSGSARRPCIGSGANRPRPKRPGGESWDCAIPNSSPAWTWASTAISPGAISPCWPENAATRSRPPNSGCAGLAECPGDREVRARVERFAQVTPEQAPTRV